VLGAGGALTIEDRPEPAPLEGEAVVQLLRAGVCDTDLQLAAGYMGFQGTPGHEFVGRILRADAAPDRAGQLVAGEINYGCGRCESCATDGGRHCSTRSVLGILNLDGAFAEQLRLPLANLHPLPEDVPIDRLVFTEPLAAAYEIPAQIEVAGVRTLVLGGGKLGGLCARVLTLEGADVTVRGRTPGALALLAADGLNTTVEGEPDRSYDMVVEATGTPEGIEAAFGWVRPRGTVVLKSTCAGQKPINLAPVVIDELLVVGSRCGPFAPAIAALAEGTIAPENTIGARFPLEQLADAFEAARAPADPAKRKVVIDFDA
jgi:threonine dehydrogenase-like Zn-dependent dehydrogenase